MSSIISVALKLLTMFQRSSFFWKIRPFIWTKNFKKSELNFDPFFSSDVEFFDHFWHAQKLKTIGFKIYIVEIKCVPYFFLTRLKILILSCHSISKTRQRFFIELTSERITYISFQVTTLIIGSKSYVLLIWLLRDITTTYSYYYYFNR